MIHHVYIVANFSHRMTPYDTFVNRYVPYRITFQTVHPKSHLGAKYSHGCSVWTRHNLIHQNMISINRILTASVGLLMKDNLIRPAVYSSMYKIILSIDHNIIFFSKRSSHSKFEDFLLICSESKVHFLCWIHVVQWFSSNKYLVVNWKAIVANMCINWRELWVWWKSTFGMIVAKGILYCH